MNEVDRLTEQLRTAIPTFSSDERQLALELYHALAQGRPVTSRDLAASAGRPEGETEDILSRDHMNSLVCKDEAGQLIGFGGLAVRPMHHRLHVNGRTLFTWCAWDALFITPILGWPAEIVSACPETGIEVRIRLTPSGIHSVEPPDTVMSFAALTPCAFSGDVHATIASFCHLVYFFASTEAARAWIAKHPGTVLLSVHDGFTLGEELNAARWGIRRSRREGYRSLQHEPRE